MDVKVKNVHSEFQNLSCSVCRRKQIKDIAGINDKTMEMLKMLGVDYTLPSKLNLILCSSCSEQLHQAFDFKVNSMNSDMRIRSLQNSESGNVLNLEQILCTEKEEVINIQQNKVCRFCLKPNVVENCLGIGEKDAVLISKNFPEIDLSLSVEPVICCNCKMSLEILFDFVNACFCSNESKKVSIGNLSWANMHNIPDFSSDVKVKTEKNEYNLNYVEEVDSWSNVSIKQEPIDEKLIMCSEEDESEWIDGKLNEENFYVEIEKPQLSDMYFCYHCPHRTTLKASLILHMLVHQNVDDMLVWKCKICDFKTKWRTSLRTHMFLHTDKSKLNMYKCANCNYESAFKKHLRRHMQRHNRKLYLCQQCCFSSKSLTILNHHCKNYHNKAIIRTGRTKEKKIVIRKGYKCTYCPYETVKKYHMDQHIVKHRSKTDVPLHECGVCSFKTKYKASLSHHKKNHDKKNKMHEDNSSYKTAS